MVNPYGGSRLDEPLVYRLEHPVRHQFKTYTELRFHRRANMDDVELSARSTDNRKMASVVLSRLANVPKAVIDKLHPKDLLDLMAGTDDLFKLA